MALVQSPKECLVCLNSNETIFVPIEESQKIFNVCCSYVKDAINIEFLINNINGNNNQLSFCKNCFHSSLNISQLVEQLSKIKKQIDDFASCFSETIEKQRVQAKTNLQIIQFNRGNTKSQVANNQRANLDSSHRLALYDVPIDSEVNSFIHTEVSNKLIVEEVAFDEVDNDNEIVMKTESPGIFLDYIDESGTADVSDYPEEYDTNSFVTENDHEIDPFGEIETTENDNDGILVNQSKPQIGTSKSICELVSSVTMPSIKLKRIRNDVTTSRDVTFYSSKISHHEDPGVNFSNIVPGDSDLIYNSTNITTSLNQRTNQLGKKLFSCSVCEKILSSASDLRRHSLIHTGEKPHQCVVCEKCFSSSSDLKRHRLIHTGEKPYKCAYCGKAYRQSAHLHIHQRTHTGEKPYKCSMCERSFHDLSVMKYHQRSHSNEVKSYRCAYCNVAFMDSRSLQEHERIHTAETLFNCPFCELKFKSTRARLGHQNRVHSQMHRN